MRIPLLVATALLLPVSFLDAQTPTAPTFDIATIKPTDPSNLGHVGIDAEPTEINTIGTDPRALLQLAFDTPKDLIFGLPAWAESARFDVSAKDSTVDPAAAKQLPDTTSHKMLQALLVERFGLKYHIEMREENVYELTFARPAPGLKSVETKVGHTETEHLSSGNQHMIATGIPLAKLAKKFGDELHHPVIDHTGLKGFYDVDLRWHREEESATATSAADAPPLLPTAVAEQLGLKLRSVRLAVPVLVVEQFTPPTAN